MKLIKRTIYVDSLEDIDFDNVGVHFTANLGYNHLGGGSNGCTVEREYKVVFFVKEYEVNEEATKISNEEYPNEQEVVLEFNQVLNAELGISRKHHLGGYGRITTSFREINIGTRCDLWVEKL